MTTRSSQRGLTLLELLAVMAAIMLLASLLLPVIHAGRRRAMRVRCANNLRQIGMFLFMEYESACIPTNFTLAQVNSPDEHPAISAPVGLLDGVSGVLCPPAYACPILPPPPPPPEPPPPAPPPVRLRSRTDGLTCPYSDVNVLHYWDTNQPPRMSYGILSYNRGKHLNNMWEWIAADSRFDLIESVDDLAYWRHNHGVNVLLSDGAVQWVRTAEVSFPED